LKCLRSSARSIDSGDVPIIFTPAAFKGNARFERSLPAKLHDHADGCAFGSLVLIDCHHVFKRLAARSTNRSLVS